MNALLWSPLLAELDRWSEAGRRVRLWLRDDDAVAPTPQLSQLSETAERFDVPVLLAVIPMPAEDALAPALAAMPLLLPCQHGCQHENHAPPGAKKSEFGAERDPSLVLAEIVSARDRLQALLGDRIVPIFVPPWNRIAPRHARLLPAVGFEGLSCFRGDRPGSERLPRQLHTDLDVMDWQGGRKGRTHHALIAELAALLETRRASEISDATIGVLLHHRDHDDTVWSFLDTLLRLSEAHPAIVTADPRRLLEDGPSPEPFTGGP